MFERLVREAYAAFCKKYQIEPSDEAAQRFAAEATGSGTVDLMGMTEVSIVKLLTGNIPPGYA